VSSTANGAPSITGDPARQCCGLWGRKEPRWQRKREKASGAGMDMDLGAVLEDDVGVAGVGERVGDGQVVAPHHADVELPDHLLLGRRRHCAGVGLVGASELWIGGDKTSRDGGPDRHEATREGGGVVCSAHNSPVDAANGWRPAPGFIGGAACLVDNFATNNCAISFDDKRKLEAKK